MFFRIHAFQGPGFSGSGSRVRVQVLEVASKKRYRVIRFVDLNHTHFKTAFNKNHV